MISWIVSPLARYLGIAVLAVGLFVGGWFTYQHAVSTGETVGAARVQREFDTFRAGVDQIADVQRVANEIAESAARANNERVDRENEIKRLAAESDRAGLLRMLREARLAANSRPSAPDRAQSGGPAESRPDEAERLDGLFADALTEARLNYDRHDALIEKLRPQLVQSVR